MMTRSRKHSIAPTEQLELRILPTVKVNFNPRNGLLKITGDNDDNKVEVEGLGDVGEVEVFVNDVSVGQFVDVVSIKANLKGGDDEFFLAAIDIDGNVTANLGDGADELDMDNTATTITDTLVIGGFLKIKFGNDAGDVAELDDVIVVGFDVVMTGVADVDFNGDGTDFNPETNDITIFTNLTIGLSGFGDIDGDGRTLDFDNVSVGGTTTLNGSREIDNFELTNCYFVGNFNANMDDGNDIIDIDNGAAQKNSFESQANFSGGNDNDSLLIGIDNLFAQPELITDFETVV